MTGQNVLPLGVPNSPPFRLQVKGRPPVPRPADSCPGSPPAFAVVQLTPASARGAHPGFPPRGPSGSASIWRSRFRFPRSSSQNSQLHENQTTPTIKTKQTNQLLSPFRDSPRRPSQAWRVSQGPEPFPQAAREALACPTLARPATPHFLLVLPTHALNSSPRPNLFFLDSHPG